MKTTISICLILLMASCSKLDMKKQVVVHKEGYFYNKGYDKVSGRTGYFEWIDQDYTHNVRTNDYYKEEIVSYPGYTLAGQIVWVTVQIDGKEVYNQREKIHNLNIQVK